MLQINSKSKQVEKEVRKASSAQKETSKPAVVQKGPEKAQERKLADSSDPVCNFNIRNIASDCSLVGRAFWTRCEAPLLDLPLSLLARTKSPTGIEAAQENGFF